MLLTGAGLPEASTVDITLAVGCEICLDEVEESGTKPAGRSGHDAFSMLLVSASGVPVAHKSVGVLTTCCARKGIGQDDLAKMQSLRFPRS
jgi:hypothetical protein